MLLFLPLIFIAAVWLHEMASSAGQAQWLSNTINNTALKASSFLVFSTEILGYCKLLNSSILSVLYLFAAILMLSIFVYRHGSLLKPFNAAWFRVSDVWKRADRFTRLLCMAMLPVLLIILVQGIVFPPNNYDAMTYHMARIPHWIANASVSHYHADIYRQIYQPPFSSFVNLHIMLLSGNDLFVNVPQFIFMLLSANAALLILRGFTNNQGLTLIVPVLLFCLPAAALQASGATNNIIEAFFILSAVLYALRLYMQFMLKHALLAGLSIGLAIFTKATAYLYLFPAVLLIGLALFKRLKQTGRLKPLLAAGCLLLALLSVNAAFLSRNFKLSGNFLGTDSAESMRYVNQLHTPLAIASNTVKNAALHIGPYPINRLAENPIRALLKRIGADPDDPRLNFDRFPFAIPDAVNYEDCAPNPIHFFLLLLSIVILIYRVVQNRFSGSKLLLIFFGLLVLQVIVFNWYLKWQPWHARNHIAFFMEAVPIIVLAFGESNAFSKWLKWVLALGVLYVFTILTVHKSRPLLNVPRLTFGVGAGSPRFDKYFADRQKVLSDFQSIENSIQNQRYKTIGLDLDWNEYEYPLFRDQSRKPVCLFRKGNPSDGLSSAGANIDCIVSNRIYLSEIAYNGRVFRRKSEKCNFIAIFETKR